MVDYKAIGQRIKSYRKSADLTQETVAEYAGITTVYLSKIENGHVHPTIDLLYDICGIIGCDIGDIFRDVSPSSKNYQRERIMDLFSSCKPEVKSIAVNLLEQLAKL